MKTSAAIGRHKGHHAQVLLRLGGGRRAGKGHQLRVDLRQQVVVAALAPTAISTAAAVCIITKEARQVGAAGQQLPERLPKGRPRQLVEAEQFAEALEEGRRAAAVAHREAVDAAQGVQLALEEGRQAVAGHRVLAHKLQSGGAPLPGDDEGGGAAPRGGSGRQRRRRLPLLLLRLRSVVVQVEVGAEEGGQRGRVGGQGGGGRGHPRAPTDGGRRRAEALQRERPRGHALLGVPTGQHCHQLNEGDAGEARREGEV